MGTRDARNPFGFVVSIAGVAGVEAQGIGRTKKDAKNAAAAEMYGKLVELSSQGNQVRIV